MGTKKRAAGRCAAPRDQPSDCSDVARVRISRTLARDVNRLRFRAPVTHVYNPLAYARANHERYLALRQAIETALGDDAPPTEANEPTIEESKAAATRLITTHPDVDAIVAFNDTVAMGALAACRRLGLRVPLDISVVGYDGIPYGAVTVPPLTTMLQDSFGMAGAAIRALLECASNGSPPSGEVQLWKPELLKRGTT